MTQFMMEQVICSFDYDCELREHKYLHAMLCIGNKLVAF